MPNTTNWQDVRRRRPPNERAVTREKLRLRLAMIREQRGTSQAAVAEMLGTSQSNVSQLERSNDQMLSSIVNYVHALGGELLACGGALAQLLEAGLGAGDGVVNHDSRAGRHWGDIRTVNGA